MTTVLTSRAPGPAASYRDETLYDESSRRHHRQSLNSKTCVLLSLRSDPSPMILSSLSLTSPAMSTLPGIANADADPSASADTFHGATTCSHRREPQDLESTTARRGTPPYGP